MGNPLGKWANISRTSNALGGNMFKVGDLVVDYQGEIGVIAEQMNPDLWVVHYTKGGTGNMWIYEIKRLLCK